MSTQLIIGIIINTLAFGLMGFSDPRSGIKTPKYFQSVYFNLPITLTYFSSFLIILLSPDKLIIKIVIALLMQFLINHIIWGIITGIVASKMTKKNIEINLK